MQAAFSADSRYLATRNDNMGACTWIWDITKLRHAVLLRHIAGVRAMEWHPSRQLLAIATGSASVCVDRPQPRPLAGGAERRRLQVLLVAIGLPLCADSHRQDVQHLASALGPGRQQPPPPRQEQVLHLLLRRRPRITVKEIFPAMLWLVGLVVMLHASFSANECTVHPPHCGPAPAPRPTVSAAVRSGLRASGEAFDSLPADVRASQPATAPPPLTRRQMVLEFVVGLLLFLHGVAAGPLSRIKVAVACPPRTPTRGRQRRAHSPSMQWRL